MGELSVDADLGPIISQVNKLTQEFIKLAGVTGNSLKVTETWNKENQLISRTLRALNKDAQLVTQTIARQGEKAKALSKTVVETGKRYKELTLQQLRNAKEAGTLTKALEKELKVREQIIAQKRVATAVQGIRGSTPLGDADTRRFGDPAELARLQNALNKLQTALGNSAVNANIAKQAFNNFSVEGRAAFERLPQGVQIALRAVEKEMENTSLAAKKLEGDMKLVEQEIARLSKIRATNLTQKLFGSQVKQQTGLGDPKILSESDPAAIAAANIALQNLTKSLSGMSSETANAKIALLDLKGQGLEALGKLTPELQRKVVALQKALKGLETPAKKAREALLLKQETARRLKLAETTAAALSRQFNSLNQNASPERVAKFNSALANLQSVIRKTGVSTGSLNSAFLKLQAGGAQAFTAAEAKVVPALQRMNAAMRVTEDQVKKTGQSFGLGFNLIGRIVIGGAIHRGFFAITSALRQSVTAAKEFSIAIAEIETLSRGNAVTTEEWSESVFKLSEEFNKTAQDVAEGVYQTLSNQVAQGAEAIEFMETALRLSLATISSAEESVNALTGVINAFDLETREAGRVASQFFKIVEFGRTRLGELSNTMGRVNVIASQLGVQFEEVGAFIATATIGGVKSNEALTQLRNVFLKLLKPTDALKERLQSLGFETGAQLIEARGFVGVFDLLNKVIKEEGVVAVTEMFGRVRAITGALQAGGDGAAVFRKNLAELNSELNSSSKAADTVRDSLGDRFARQLQQASNFFTQEFGQAFIEAFVSITDALGGARRALLTFFGIIKGAAFVGVAIAVTKIAIAMTAVKIATDSAAVSLTRFQRAKAFALSPSGIFILIVATIELAKILDNLYTDAAEASKEYFDRVEKGLAKQKKDFETHQGFVTNSIRKTATEAARAWFASIAEQRKELFSLQNELKIRNKEIGRALTASLKETEKAAKALIKEPADAIKELTSSIESAQERIKAIVQTTEGNIFEKSIDQAKDINDQLKLIDDRIEELQTKGVEAAVIGDEKSAIRFFAQIQKLQTRQAKLVGDFTDDQTDATQKLSDLRIKNSQLEFQATEKQLKLRSTRRDSGLDSRERRIALQRIGIQLEKNENQQVKNTEEIRKQEKLLNTQIRGGLTVEQIQTRRQKSLDIEKQTLADIIALNEIERVKQQAELKRRQVLTNNFFKSLEDLNNLERDLKDEVEGTADATEAQARALNKVDALRRASEDIPLDFNARLNLTRTLAEKENNIRERFIVKNQNTLLDAREKTAREDKKLLEDKLKNEQEVIAQLKKAEIDRLSSLGKTRVSFLQAVKDIRASLDTTEKRGLFAESIKEQRDLVTGSQAVLGLFKRLQNNRNIEAVANAIANLTEATEGNFDQLADAAEAILRRFTQNIEASRNAAGLSREDLQAADPRLTLLEDLARVRLQEVIEAKAGRKARLEQERGLESTQTQIKNLTQAQDDASTALEEQKKAVSDLAGIQKLATDTQKKHTEAVKKQNEVTLRLQANRTRAARNETVPRFAHGGMARGTDTVPAMLTPGEFVMNRRSSAAFLPILRAMNAGGVKTQRFQDGGTVEGDQSVSIGDVNINAGSAHITTSELTRLLKQAVFEKKIRLKGL